MPRSRAAFPHTASAFAIACIRHRAACGRRLLRMPRSDSASRKAPRPARRPFATARGDGDDCRLLCTRRWWRRPALRAPSSGCAGRVSGRTPAYRVTVPVKVSRPPPRLESSTPLIRPPPLSPSKRPTPITTFQSLRCSTSGGVEVKVIVRVPPGQRNDLSTVRLGSCRALSRNFPPAQKAESPMVDPERTSPVDSPCALRGAKRVLIRIGSPLSLASVSLSSPPAAVWPLLRRWLFRPRRHHRRRRPRCRGERPSAAPKRRP